MRIAIDFDDTIVDGITKEVLDTRFACVISKWIESGHQCYILTGRHQPLHIKEVEELLMLYSLAVPVVSIGSYKMTLKLDHEWDILIDDSFDIWAEHKERGDKRRIVMKVRRTYLSFPDAVQATNWAEIELLVNRIVNEDTTH